MDLKGQTSNDFSVPHASSPPPYSIVLDLYSHSVLNDIDRLLQQLQKNIQNMEPWLNELILMRDERSILRNAILFGCNYCRCFQGRGGQRTVIICIYGAKFVNSLKIYAFFKKHQQLSSNHGLGWFFWYVCLCVCISLCLYVRVYVCDFV